MEMKFQIHLSQKVIFLEMENVLESYDERKKRKGCVLDEC